MAHTILYDLLQMLMVIESSLAKLRLFVANGLLLAISAFLLSAWL
jgi:hypothetical protein